MKIKNVIEWKTEDGEAVTTAGITVTPQSRLLQLQLPFAGFVWNRPSAVIVQQAGEKERIPIMDVTRTAILTLFATAVLLGLLVGRFIGKQ